MNKKKLLFLTHYFPPEVNAPANRTYEHCRIWKNDLDITVITNVPNHPDGRIFPGYENKLYQKEVVDGINVIRLWTFITPNEGFILRTLNYIIYMIVAVIYVLISNIKFDIVIATTPQFFCGLAGKFIAKIGRKPFILELRDLWPESIVAVGALKNKAIIQILEKIELNLYRSSNKIISVTNAFKENLIHRGIASDKIEIVYNGISIDIFSNNQAIENKEIEQFLSTGFIVGYIGTLGLAHAVDIFVRAAELNNNIKYLIVGSGAQRNELEITIKSKSLSNIKIFPNQQKKNIPYIISKLSLFCVHLKKNDLFKTVIPSKMFEGMIMRKPIIIGVDGEAKNIVYNGQCGLFFEPENELELLKIINTYRNNPQLIIEHGEKGYDFVINNFNRDVLADKLFVEIKKLLNKDFNYY